MNFLRLSGVAFVHGDAEAPSAPAQRAEEGRRGRFAPLPTLKIGCRAVVGGGGGGVDYRNGECGSRIRKLFQSTTRPSLEESFKVQHAPECQDVQIRSNAQRNEEHVLAEVVQEGDEDEVGEAD